MSATPAAVQTPATSRGTRKVRLGYVIADKMNKTVIVQVGSSKAHRLYRKTVQQRTRFKVHDEKNECGVGHLARIAETRPIHKEKRWAVLEMLGRSRWRWYSKRRGLRWRTTQGRKRSCASAWPAATPASTPT